MGYLKFIYGTMSSGKTTLLLQNHYNTSAAFPGQSVLLNKYDRSGDNVCSSRIGHMDVSISVDNGDSLVEVISKYEEETKNPVRFVFVDEAQFFLPKQIEDLAFMADAHDVQVTAFGLLTSYKGKMFEASKRLLELADRSMQIDNQIRCWCGNRATHNALYIGGDIQTSGEDNVIDNNSVVEYNVLCRKHFLELTGSYRNSGSSSKVHSDQKTLVI